MAKRQKGKAAAEQTAIRIALRKEVRKSFKREALRRLADRGAQRERTK